MKTKKPYTNRCFYSGRKESGANYRQKIQERTLVLCAQMIIELCRRAKKEVKTDEPENHL